jgi:hypothetical protein
LSYPASVSTVLGFVGAGLLANAAWMCIERLSASGVTTGRVVDHEVTTSSSIEPSSEPTTLYRPVIEFAYRQRRYRFTAVGADLKPRPERGTRMRVRFRPGDPETAYVATFSNLWVMPLVWAVSGALALYIAWR